MNGGMSAIGTKQTSACALHMSAFGGKADMAPAMGQKQTFRPSMTMSGLPPISGHSRELQLK